jgi:hypothetical protein
VIYLTTEEEQLPPPPNFEKPLKFGQMLRKIKKIRADLSQNRLNSGNFITILQKNSGKLSTAPLILPTVKLLEAVSFPSLFVAIHLYVPASMSFTSSMIYVDFFLTTLLSLWIMV